MKKTILTYIVSDTDQQIDDMINFGIRAGKEMCQPHCFISPEGRHCCINYLLYYDWVIEDDDIEKVFDQQMVDMYNSECDNSDEYWTSLGYDVEWAT